MSTNAQEQSEGPIADLIDGDESTYFHSAWNNDPTPEGTNHYIQVALNEPIKSFYFCTKRRAQNTNNRPTQIKILVSQDGETFTGLTTISDGLVAHASDYMSPKIESETEFKYVRFEVMKTNTSSKFFTYSEFYMLDAAEYAKVEAVKDIDFIKTKTAEEIQETCTKLYNSISNTAIYKELQAVLTEVKSINWGTKVGQYAKPDNYDQIIAEAEAATSESPYETIEASKNALENILNTLVINQPEAGKFYRFLGATGAYLSATEAKNNRMMMTETGDESTIFYLTSDNRLVTPNAIGVCEYYITGNNITGLGSEYTFEDAGEGKYFIVTNHTISGNSKRASWYAKPAGEVVDRWADSYSGQKNCVWQIVEVEEAINQPTLSRTIGDAGYATLGAPVALNIPKGVKAYTVTVNEEKTVATLNEVTDGIIPAGCGVVLEKTDEGSEYNFTFAAGTDATIGENALVPLYTETTLGTDINAYILATKSGLGFYQLDPESRTIGANKAYLKLPATMNHVRSITIGGPTTGIEETVANGNETEEYYDLQGRRVQNPTKGIYVTKSGKKVIINK